MHAITAYGRAANVTDPSLYQNSIITEIATSHNIDSDHFTDGSPATIYNRGYNLFIEV